MARRIAKGMPTTEIVDGMLARGTLGSANAVMVHPITVGVPLSTGGSTANAAFLAWINPEAGTIVVTDVMVYFGNATATGTGTFDMGVSADGTGSNDNIYDGGTMSGLTSVLETKRFASQGTEGFGTAGKAVGYVIGPGGSGTNNSIVAKTSETATTAKGWVYITYFVTGT